MFALANPELLAMLVDVFCQALKEAYEQVNISAIDDMARRIIKVLVGLASKLGQPADALVAQRPQGRPVDRALLNERIAHPLELAVALVPRLARRVLALAVAHDVVGVHGRRAQLGERRPAPRLPALPPRAVPLDRLGIAVVGERRLAEEGRGRGELRVGRQERWQGIEVVEHA